MASKAEGDFLPGAIDYGMNCSAEGPSSLEGELVADIAVFQVEWLEGHEPAAGEQPRAQFEWQESAAACTEVGICTGCVAEGESVSESLVHGVVAVEAVIVVAVAVAVSAA